MEEDESMMDYFERSYKEMVQFDRYLGMELTVEAPGEISYTLEIKPEHLTAPNSAHGGVVAAMMDATLGVAALSWAVTNGNLCATVEFKINYLKQTGPGSILISTGRIKHKGNRLIVSEGNISELDSGELVATGLGTFSQYPMGKRADLQQTNFLDAGELCNVKK